MVEREPNDIKETTNDVDFGLESEVVITGISQDQEDKDYFGISPTGDRYLNVDGGSNNSNFAQLEVEDEVGKEIFKTEPNEGLNSGTVHLQVGENYTIRLRSKNDAAAEYRLVLSFNETFVDDDPVDDNLSDPGLQPEPSDTVLELGPNDKRHDANPFAFGSDRRVSLVGMSEDSDDKDFF